MGIACPLTFLFLVFLPFAVLGLHNVNRRPTRQFTIRGMLFFTFLWAVCLSQVSVISDHTVESVTWRQAWIVLCGWLVLAVFYERTRQFAALLIHGWGILYYACFVAIAIITGDTGSVRWLSRVPIVRNARRILRRV